jgi:microcompartment protein CcmK/EutM
MFWIAPIQTPIIPVRRSPKYFHVSDSGPSGAAEIVVLLSGSAGRRAAEVRGSLEGIDVTVITAS